MFGGPGRDGRFGGAAGLKLEAALEQRRIDLATIKDLREENAELKGEFESERGKIRELTVVSEHQNDNAPTKDFIRENKIPSKALDERGDPGI